MSAARKLVESLSEADLDRIAERLEHRRAARLREKREAAPPVIEPTELDRAEAERIAKRLGLRVKRERW
jgi:hypothetical protein